MAVGPSHYMLQNECVKHTHIGPPQPVHTLRYNSNKTDKQVKELCYSLGEACNEHQTTVPPPPPPANIHTGDTITHYSITYTFQIHVKVKIHLCNKLSKYHISPSRGYIVHVIYMTSGKFTGRATNISIYDMVP